MPRAHVRAYLCPGSLDPGSTKRKADPNRAGRLVQTVSDEGERNVSLFEMIAAQTFQAQDSGGLLAKKPEIDLLLRLAGTTQISDAIKKRGAVNGKEFLLVVADRTAVKEVSELVEFALPRKELTRRELQKVERSALLNAQRA